MSANLFVCQRDSGANTEEERLQMSEVKCLYFQILVLLRPQGLNIFNMQKLTEIGKIFPLRMFYIKKIHSFLLKIIYFHPIQ